MKRGSGYGLIHRQWLPHLWGTSVESQGLGIGLMNDRYREYLRSDDWQQKRRQKLNRRGGKCKRCAICGSTSRLDIHHLSYQKDLTKVPQSDLRILCRECHECAHRLMANGVLAFRDGNHHHRFTLTKIRVMQSRGIARGSW